MKRFYFNYKQFNILIIMVFVFAIIIACVALGFPIVYTVKNKINDTQIKTTETINDNSIFKRIANDVAVIKFWVQFFAIVQIIAFIIGLILVCVKCS